MGKRNGNRGIFFQFVGSSSNRDGIGTRVEITVGDRSQMAEVQSASGFQSQSPREVFFGVGGAATIDRVQVYWPSGKTQTFNGLAANRYITIHEDDGIVTERTLGDGTGDDLAVETPYREVHRQRVFASVRPAPSFELTDLEGNPLTLDRSPVIVCLLTTWLPGLEEQLEALESLAEAIPDVSVTLLLVTSEIAGTSETGRATVAASGMRAAACDYRLAIRYANQANVLFPSAFLVRDGKVILDMVGKLDPEQALPAIRSALSTR